LEERTVAWEDLIRGPQTIEASSLSDPVLVRADGTYLYTLTSVVDDAEFGVTHIIRGEDHVANTGVQLQIFEALGAPAPALAHHNLLVGADGQALSKRLGSLSIASLRESGIEAMAVVSHAALVGTSDSIHPCLDYEELIAGFDLAKLSRAPARFDEAELQGLNARLLHKTPHAAVKDRLGGLSEDFWLAVRGNLSVLADAEQWKDIVYGEIPATPKDAFAREAAAALPPEPWDGTTWKTWTEALKARTDRKGKALFMPLRLALTGLDHGPELASLLPLIGRDRALKRLA
jgi:glutamyl-tRNA synthetase